MLFFEWTPGCPRVSQSAPGSTQEPRRTGPAQASRHPCAQSGALPTGACTDASIEILRNPPPRRSRAIGKASNGVAVPFLNRRRRCPAGHNSQHCDVMASLGEDFRLTQHTAIAREIVCHDHHDAQAGRFSADRGAETCGPRAATRYTLRQAQRHRFIVDSSIGHIAPLGSLGPTREPDRTDRTNARARRWASWSQRDRRPPPLTVAPRPRRPHRRIGPTPPRSTPALGHARGPRPG